jgi:hypothetical protein
MPSDLMTNVLLTWLRGARVGIVVADSADGCIALTYSRQYRATVAVLFVLASAMLLFVLPFWGDLFRVVLAATILGLMWLGMAYAVYDAFLCSVRASAEGLVRRGVFSGVKSLAWSQLSRVSYSTLGNWYTFRSGDGWAIRVSIYRNGLKSFAKIVAANIARSPAQYVPSSFYEHAAA